MKVQGLFPIPSGSMGTSRPTDDLNLNCSGKEKQMLSQDVRDSKTPRSFGFGTLPKTQSDAIITQQLVKDKLRATTHSFYVHNPLNSEPRKAIFVQTPKCFLVPMHFTNKPRFHVSRRPLVNTQGIPAPLLLNKKPGMILTFKHVDIE